LRQATDQLGQRLLRQDIVFRGVVRTRGLDPGAHERNRACAFEPDGIEEGEVVVVGDAEHLGETTTVDA
jgi:hypothetical protein